MENLPLYVSLVFAGTVLLTLWFLYQSSNRSKKILLIAIAWLIIQGIIGLSRFYTVTNTLPPRMTLLLAPPLIGILLLFFMRPGRYFIDSLNNRSLTLFHVVRVPVELVIFWLFVHQAVPQLMTFEGRNFDIISGLTAPLIYYFGYVKNQLSSKIILAWNIICLGLVANIVFHGILSVPTPFQQFGFDQPNIGLLYFPFIFLPGFIVPVVLFAHLVCIRQLVSFRTSLTNEKSLAATG